MKPKHLLPKTSLMHSYEQNLFCFLLLVLFSFCFTESIKAQLAEDKVIPNDKLKWEYYTARPDSNSNYWASTLWNVYYKYHIISFHSDTVKIELNVWHVLKANSWVREDKESGELLHHEQGHFNTAVLLEGQFKKAIDTTTLLNSNYAQTIDSVFNVLLKSISELNIEYDKETNHMWNKEAQKQWDGKIDEMINKTTK